MPEFTSGNTKFYSCRLFHNRHFSEPYDIINNIRLCPRNPKGHKAMLTHRCFAPAALGFFLLLTPEISAMNVDSIPDDAYVTVSPEGHLMQNGKRVRFWGIIGHWMNTRDLDKAHESGDSSRIAAAADQTRKNLVAMADRMVDMGFNLVRLWAAPTLKPYKKGDLSCDDLYAGFLVELDKRNIRIWNSVLMGGAARIDDVNLVNDPATAEAWKQAVKKAGGEISCWSCARVWDRRIEAAAMRNRAKYANWRNAYKGDLRWADDPQVVVWELENEERWQQKMFRGEWLSLPRFFQDELIQQWNGFLKTKYGTDAKLCDAWLGLLPGESMAAKTIQLMPLLDKTSAIMPSDANPQVLALLKKTAGQKYGREHFNRQRGADVVEFLVKILIESKTREKEALEKEGKSTRLSPCIMGTAEGYDIHDLYKYQFSDATAIATYMNGFHHDSTYKRFPWYSGLEEPPRTGWNVPWLETQRIPNKPFIVYECGFENPAKYRAEWPYRILALASIQDFDIINWHIWGHLPDQSRKNPWDGAMAYSHPEWNKGAGPLGLIYQNDEVYTAALKGAGEIFKNDLLKPAPKPTTFVFGTKSLYDPSTMDYGIAYGRIGDRVMPTAYRYGLQMYCDTSREDDTVIGPAFANRIFEPMPFKPTEQIEFDWHKGHLKLDAPGAVGYVGFFAQYGGPVKFSNGIILDKVTMKNDSGIAYPVTNDELYVCFSAAARDGRPLNTSRDVLITLVSTSFNKGFKLDHSKFIAEFLWQENPKAVVEIGKWPVLFAKPGATITAPMLNGMKYSLVDWHMKTIGTGVISGGKFDIPADKPVFCMQLTR